MKLKEEFIEKYQKAPVVEIDNNVAIYPLVSISVITYNHKDYISTCLDGILMQKTTFPFEILLGEDDSSDGTREICIEYAKKYPDKIRLFLHSRKNNILRNGSPTWHFNSLYNHLNARGKYLAVCEGDDYWTCPNKLQKQIDFLESNKNFSACSNLANVIFDGTLKQNENRFKRDEAKTEFYINDFLEHTRMHTGSLVFRRNLLNISRMKRYGLFALNRDHPTLIILASQGPIKRLPEIMSVYRRNVGGFSENINFKDIYKSNIEMVDALSGYLDTFYFKAWYMRGHWHRFLLKDPNENHFRKFYHFLFFFVSSFYIFPRNGGKIFNTIKSVLLKKNA